MEENMTTLFLGWEDAEEKTVPVRLYTDEIHKEELDSYAEDLGTASRAQALRLLVEIGRRSIVQNDPRNQPGSGEGSATTIRELVPKGEENSVDLRSELMEIIDKQILEIIEDDPEINREGWEVYR